MTAPVLERWLEHTTFAPPGLPVRVGCSGGADSLALLALAAAAGCEVTAVHVDHGVRPEAAAEADVVEQAAAEVGARFESHRVAVEAGSNLEARMRTARYAVLGSEAATGHTADDQAETVLINLLRGAGIRGLGAMAPGPRRPILALRRSDTEAACRTMGWTPVLDPSNADPAFLRNRVRHELMPLLTELAGRDVVPLLGRTASHMRSADDVLSGLAAEVDPADARALAAAPDAVASEVVRSWIQDATAAEHPIDAASVERVLAVAAGEVRAAEVVGGHRVERSEQRLRIVRADE